MQEVSKFERIKLGEHRGRWVPRKCASPYIPVSADTTATVCIKENMGQGEDLNVFSGADSISRYFDPDNLPLLPLVEIPSKLNPLRNEKVRIYAKMLTAHPALNVKALPGNHKSLVQYSSR